VRAKGKGKEIIELLNKNVGAGFYVCDLAVMLGVSETTVRRHLEDLRMRFPESIKVHRYYGKSLYVIKAPIPEES
jgi:predicted ArsR family transcriptional regulator